MERLDTEVDPIDQGMDMILENMNETQKARLAALRATKEQQRKGKPK